MAKIRINFILKGSLDMEVGLDKAALARLVDDGPYTEGDLTNIIGDRIDSHALVDAIDDSEFEVDAP